MNFNGSCSTTDRVFTPNKIINLYIVFKIESWPIYTEDALALRNSLFGGVKLNKNLDPDKYFYSGYGISFDIHGTFSLSSGRIGKNVIIFGYDTS